MSNEQALAEYVKELLAGEPITCRRMFGGSGIFYAGKMFALIADGELFLKADDKNRKRFEDAALKPFVYYKKNKPMTMSYYECPPEALDNEEAMRDWAQSSFAAALRANKWRQKITYYFEDKKFCKK